MSPYQKMPSDRLLKANWILSAAMEQASLHSIMEAASQIFQSPVIYVDDHFRIIDSSPKDPEAIPEPRCMVKECCLNEQVIWQVLKEYTDAGNDFYEPFYIPEGICSGEPLLLGEVVQNGHLRGHLMICIGQRPCGQEELQLGAFIKDGRIVRQDVVTGISNDTDVEIKEGIAAGDTVVTAADTELTEGMQAVPILR